LFICVSLRTPMMMSWSMQVYLKFDGTCVRTIRMACIQLGSWKAPLIQVYQSMRNNTARLLTMTAVLHLRLCSCCNSFLCSLSDHFSLLLLIPVDEKDVSAMVILVLSVIGRTVGGSCQMPRTQLRPLPVNDSGNE
jgi:hypothetical protein